MRIFRRIAWRLFNSWLVRGAILPFDERGGRVHLISTSANTIPPHAYGGIELVITNLARGLLAEGVEVWVYAPGEIGIDGVRHVKTLVKPQNWQNGQVANVSDHLDAIAEGLLMHFRPGDVIHLHHAEQYRALLTRLLQRAPHRALSMARAMTETAHWLEVGLPHRIVYPSRRLQTILQRPGTVIPHGNDLSQFYREPDIIPGFHLLYAGRITPDKGVHLSAEAAQQAGRPLHVAGPKQDPAYFDALPGDVVYLGNLGTAALRREYNRAAAVLYMTQYDEPFGLTIVEAMACGCPVITTGKGGTGETVLEGETGYFCQTVAEVVAAVAALPRLSREACIARAAEYGIPPMARRYRQWYESMT